jgi:hypothetical protein
VESAYIYVASIPTELRSKLIQIISASVNSGAVHTIQMGETSSRTSTDRVTHQTFDELQEFLEDELATHVFRPFFKSEFYQMYQEKYQTLSDGSLSPLTTSEKTNSTQ